MVQTNGAYKDSNKFKTTPEWAHLSISEEEETFFRSQKSLLTEAKAFHIVSVSLSISSLRY